MKQRICMNGRFLTQPLTGVQRYSRELMNHIDVIIGQDPDLKDVEVECLTPSSKMVIPDWENITVRCVGKNESSLWEQMDLPQYLRGQLLFSPANIGPWNYSNQVVTFHDASIFAIPEAYSRVFRLKYRFIFKQLVKKARRIFTDSKFSQQELAKYLKVESGIFQVIYLGSNHLNRVCADHRIQVEHRLENKPYLLMVSSVSRHKNYARVIEATRKLNSDINLVIVGGNYKKIFNDFELDSLPGNVNWLTDVNDHQLKSLYEKAAGLVFPSIYEGFGLPPLEAMQSGCPVICANSASMPEIIGDAGLYFDPFRVDQIAETIDCFLSDTHLQETLRQKGYSRCKKFDWLNTAHTTLNTLLDLC